MILQQILLKYGLNNNSSNQAGLSLVEVLVSIVLLGVIAAFIALAIPTSATLATRTDKMEATTAAAQKYIEEVKSTYTNNNGLFANVQEGYFEPVAVTNEHTNNGAFNITTNVDVIANVDNSPSMFVLQVTVAPADLADNQTSDQTVTISSLIRKEN